MSSNLIRPTSLGRTPSLMGKRTNLVGDPRAVLAEIGFSGPERIKTAQIALSLQEFWYALLVNKLLWRAGFDEAKGW